MMRIDSDAVGKTAVYQVKSRRGGFLSVPVLIKDVRRVWGRLEYRVEVTAASLPGQGVWVQDKNIILEDEP